MKIITTQDGIFPLQHKGYKDGDFDLDYRACVMAVRVRSRLVEDGDLGHWVYRKEEVGDVTGAMFWEVDVEKRPIPSFQFAWPVQAVPSQDSFLGVEMNPLANDTELGASEDDRFISKPFRRIVYRESRQQATQSKFPVGTYGVGMTATEENEQIDLFLHADARLVAPNVGRQGIMGTQVFDLTNTGRYDENRGARVQTAWRVVRPTMACTAGVVSDEERPGRYLNALAWNLALTGQEAAFGRGLWIDNAWGSGGTAT